MRRQLLPALRMVARPHRALRPRLPAGRDRRRPRCCSPTRPTARSSSVDGEVVGSVAGRPELHRARVLPPPPVGRRAPARRARRTDGDGNPVDRRRPTRDRTSASHRASEPGTDQPGPARRRRGAGRRLPRGERSGRRRPVPVDAVTASASGLDPHISVANARLQAPRVADERGLPVDEVLALIDEHTDGRSLGLPRRAGRERARAQPRPRRRLTADSARWRRGQLRIYLGAAPGVGKTFAMLNEGWRRRRAGHRRGRRLRRDPRPARAPPSRSRDLEVVPRAQVDVPRQPRSRRWTSTPSSPGAPTVALVDELAHTNVPGSRQREALAGRRGAARRRHRRHLDGQHPAPRVAERRRRADHRRQAARDDPRRGRARAPTRSSSST